MVKPHLDPFGPCETRRIRELIREHLAQLFSPDRARLQHMTDADLGACLWALADSGSLVLAQDLDLITEAARRLHVRPSSRN